MQWVELACVLIYSVVSSLLLSIFKFQLKLFLHRLGAIILYITDKCMVYMTPVISYFLLERQQV